MELAKDSFELCLGLYLVLKIYILFLQDFRYMATSDLIEMLKDPSSKQDRDTE